MDTTTAILIGLFLFLFFGTIIFALYVWMKKSVYTREKFAFFGLAAGSTLTLFVVAGIFFQESPLLAAIGLIKQLLGLPYQAPQPLNIEQNILLLILVFGFWWSILRIHRQWNGAQSTNHYEQLQKQQSPSLIADSWLLLHPKRNRALLEIHNPAFQFRPSALEGAEESLVWREQARDLLQLSNRKSIYVFHDDDWHDQESCWIGKHGGTGCTVVLACREKLPSGMELQALVDYVNRVLSNKGASSLGLEFIIALKEGDVDKRGTLHGYNSRTVSEARLLDDLVNFDDYFRDLRKRVEKDTLTGSGLTLEQVYTVSRFKLGKDSEEQPDLEAFLDSWLAESGQRQIALLGEYGQGKSTASLMFGYRLLQRIKQDPRSARIPILLELRGKSPRTLREDELLSTWAGRYGVDTRALIKLLVAGRLLLIFEGFDEVDLSGDADARIAHFKVMWGLCYPKAKVLVTGRPNYFFDDTELKAALGIHERSMDRPYCQAVSLVPFDSKGIEHSLRNLDKETRDGILELASENERFYDIVSRPSMLHVVGVLWRAENLAQYGARINSAMIMDLFVRHSLERQSGKGQRYDFKPPAGSKAQPGFMALNSCERTYFMDGIATYMLINRLPNQITGKQLDEVVRLLIDIIPDAVSSQADAQGRESRKPLRQRYNFESTAEDIQTVRTDVRTCGLLVKDLSRSGCFKFGHKSFQEFLAGKTFAQWNLSRGLDDPEKIGASSLVNRLGLSMLDVVRQPEVMAFAIEWIVGKAKKQDQAGQLLFALIFKVHNIRTRMLADLLKLGLWCMHPMLKLDLRSTSVWKPIYFSMIPTWLCTVAVFFDVTFSGILQLPRFLLPCVLMVNYFGAVTFYNTFNSFYRFASNNSQMSRLLSKMLYMGLSMGLSIFVSIIVFPGIFTTVVKTKYIVLDLALFTLFVYLFAGLLLYLALHLIAAVILALCFGYWQPKPECSWMRFRIWYAICDTAHLDRSAMVGVVGNKSLRLLEDVANKDARPWSLAESLERLKETMGQDTD